MGSIRHSAIIIAIIIILPGLSLTAGCSRKTSDLPYRNQEIAGEYESHWAATYTVGGESISLTLILAAGVNSEQTRLVALSAFGATLGDCVVENGRGQCRREAVRGAEGLMTRISGAIAVMLERDPDFLAKPGRVSARIGALGWEAKRDAAGIIEYRPAAPSNWALVMKQVAAK